MKHIKFLSIAALAVMTVAVSSCRDDWSEMNQNPSQITTTNPNYLFHMATLAFENSGYTYWFYNANDIFRLTQFGVPTASVTSTWNEITGYSGNSLIENRRYYFSLVNEIAQLDEETQAAYAPTIAAADVLQIMLGIQATDFSGDVAYTEAAQAPWGGTLTPKLDRVKDLYDLWLSDLDNDIKIFTSTSNSMMTAKQDVIYKADMAKWAKLANSLKLKIAARLISQDANRANSIASEVAKASCGVLDGSADDLIFNKCTENNSNSDYVYHWNNGILSSIAPSKDVIDFMVSNQDPRVRFMFRKNSWNSKVVQAFLAANKKSNIPSYIMDNIELTADGNFAGWKNLGEPWVRYYGIPGDFDAANDQTFGEWFDYGKPERCQFDTEHTYRPYSLFQTEMIYGRVDYTIPTAPGDPIITDTNDNPWYGMYLTTAEVNLYLAEFALRGASLPQSAATYFNKAVKASVEEYDRVAGLNKIPYYGTVYGYDDNEEVIDLKPGEIDAMMANADYQLTGNKALDLEKVYLQQMFHFFLNPMDMWVTARRSGLPKINSTLLPRFDYASNGIPVTNIARRGPVTIPNETSLMYQNYLDAYKAQGFTAGTNDMNVLNSERVWADQGAPQWGAGPSF